ncbi:MAG: hypothetical protein FWH41_06125 [Treponema sp.]|nr:hypothetical protein [Treponema sp.]
MVQLYFLSILFNGIAGFLLFFGDSEKTDSFENNAKMPLSGSGHRLILGIITAIIGFLKLLLPMRTIIVGDLFPAAAGLLGGFILIFDYYREHSAKIEGSGKISQIGDVFLVYRKIAGIVLFVVTGLHFLLPYALFL